MVSDSSSIHQTLPGFLPQFSLGQSEIHAPKRLPRGKHLGKERSREITELDLGCTNPRYNYMTLISLAD